MRKNYRYNNNKNYSLRCIALAIYIISLPVANLQLGSIGSLLKYIAIIPIGLNLLLLLKGRKFKINTGQLWLMAFGLILISSGLYTLDSSVTTGRSWTYVLAILLIVFTTMFSYSKEEIKLLRYSMFISGITTALCVIFFSAKIEGGTRLTLGGEGIFVEDPNYLCGYFIFPIIYCIHNINKNNKKNRKLYLIEVISIISFFIIILMTGSRGGLVGVIGGIGAYYLLSIVHSKKKMKSIINIAILIIFAIILGNLIINQLPVELQQRYSIQAILDSKGTGRFDLWETGIKMYINSGQMEKVIGYGAGTIRLISVDEQMLWNVVHNFWIETLLELGVMGVLAIGGCYLMFFKKAYNNKDFVAMATFVGFICMTVSLSLNAYKPLWNLMVIISLYSKRNVVKIHENKASVFK